MRQFKTLQPLRTVKRIITRPSSRLEPATVELSCGHTTHTGIKSKHARCPTCRRVPRITPLQQPSGHIVPVKRRAVDLAAIFVRAEPLIDTQPSLDRARAGGPVVLKLDLWQKVDGRKQRRAFSRRIKMSDARAVGYVLERLDAALKEIDGSVIILDAAADAQ